MTKLTVDAQVFEDLANDAGGWQDDELLVNITNTFENLHNIEYSSVMSMFTAIDYEFRLSATVFLYFVFKEDICYIYTGSDTFTYNDGYMNFAIEERQPNHFYVRSDL